MSTATELCPDRPCKPLPPPSFAEALWRLRDPADPGVLFRRQVADMLEAYCKRARAGVE